MANNDQYRVTKDTSARKNHEAAAAKAAQETYYASIIAGLENDLEVSFKHFQMFARQVPLTLADWSSLLHLDSEDGAYHHHLKPEERTLGCSSSREGRT